MPLLPHLVGDLHQPLHCADRGDKGGNAVEVRWFKRRSNLHRVWDSDILAQLPGLRSRRPDPLPQRVVR